ncbi:MAG: phosphatidylserine synthase [Candidatus Azotimanducaceae bacterium]|jgi:phosphatidylserine synthase|tara:strand:- start:20126 stop:20785 length:660 start_codon:yes stop_codon:yes gene_type:complete
MFMTIDKAELPIKPPTILSFVKDLPNLCSLAGLACTLLSIYFSILGIFHGAMIGMVWAVAFDWADGLIARRMHGRSGNERVFGGQLDLVIDIVSYGVAPAVLVMSYGDFNPAFLLCAFLMLAASAIRLSYFSTFGLSDKSQYTGLALDNNNLILVFVFLFEGFFSKGQFSIALYICGVLLAGLNVAQIRTPKLSSNPRNVYILALYTLAITAFYLSHLV